MVFISTKSSLVSKTKDIPVATFDHVLAPGKIGTLELANRVILAPMGTEMGTHEGLFTDREIAYYTERANGGTALIMTGISAVSQDYEVINEGLPRAAYKIIGDRTRRSLNRRIGISNALILTQILLGLIMSIAIFAAAKQFADKFVPAATRAESVQYIRIAAFSSLFSALDVAVSACTRSLDRWVSHLSLCGVRVR